VQGRAIGMKINPDSWHARNIKEYITQDQMPGNVISYVIAFLRLILFNIFLFVILGPIVWPILGFLALNEKMHKKWPKLKKTSWFWIKYE